MPTPIEQELLEVTGEKPKGTSEEEQDYIARLTRAVTKVPETDWDKLSQPVQDFSNECIRALKRKKTLPGFPDTEETDMATKSKAKKPGKKAEPEAETAAEPEAEPKKRGRPKKEGAPEVEPKKTRGRGENSINYKITQMFITNTKITKDAVCKRLEKAGVTFSPLTVGVQLKQAQVLLGALRAAGMLKKGV